MNRSGKIRIQAGFGLLELFVTLLVLGIVLGLALPDFRLFVDRSKSDATIGRLAQALEFARLAAIGSGGLVTLCRSRDARTCGGEWRDGVLIFSDSNGDRMINQQDQALRYLVFPESAGSIRWRAFGGRQYLQITSQGFTRYQNGNFTYCPDNGDLRLARQLIVNRLARLRLALDTDGDGIREDSQGRPLNCS